MRRALRRALVFAACLAATGCFLIPEDESSTYRGPEPSSEPETRAAVEYLRAMRPAAVYSFHCLASICGMRFITARAAREDTAYAQACERFSHAYCLGMEPCFPRESIMGFVCSAGSLPAWCYRELGVPAFDLEISGLEVEARAACAKDQTTRELVREYRRRHLAGLTAVLEMVAR